MSNGAGQYASLKYLSNLCPSKLSVTHNERRGLFLLIFWRTIAGMLRLEHNISEDKGRPIDFIEMTLNPSFDKAVLELRKKWEIDTDYLTSNTKEAQDDWMRLLENTSLHADVQKLLTDLNISLSWDEVVQQYVVDGDTYYYKDESSFITKNSKGLVLSVNMEEPYDIVLHVGPETIYSDFKKAWKKIEKYRKVPLPRKRVRTQFIRDYTIFTQARNGASIQTIHAVIKNKFGEDLDYGNIKKIVSEFYNRLGIPEKERRKLKTK